jgi:hypothetical protein
MVLVLLHLKIVDLVEELKAVPRVVLVAQLPQVQYVMVLSAMVHNHLAWLTHLLHHHRYHSD